MSTLVTPISVAVNSELPSIALIAILTLFALLVGKELLMGSGRWQSHVIQRVFNVGIIPLAVIFGVLIIQRMLQILG